MFSMIDPQPYHYYIFSLKWLFYDEIGWWMEPNIQRINFCNDKWSRTWGATSSPSTIIHSFQIISRKQALTELNFLAWPNRRWTENIHEGLLWHQDFLRHRKGQEITKNFLNIPRILALLQMALFLVSSTSDDVCQEIVNLEANVNLVKVYEENNNNNVFNCLVYIFIVHTFLRRLSLLLLLITFICKQYIESQK